MRNSQDAV